MAGTHRQNKEHPALSLVRGVNLYSSAYQHPLGLQGKAGVGDSYTRKSETRSGSPCSILVDNAHGRM